VLTASVLLSMPPPARAADNAALGGIGGIDNQTLVGGDGTGEARLTLFSTDLALIKQARDLSGTVLPDGTDVSPGQEIWFVVYVDNPTVVAAGDTRITDALDESDFLYIPDSLEQTVVPSGSNDASIWAGTWTPLTDAVGSPDDGASAVDTGGAPGPDRITLGAVSGQANRNVDVPAGSLRALRFRVRVN
jgi:hypothetical protein